MHPDDEKLVQLWVDRKITYEDALRRAKSAGDVRLGIKLRDEFWNRPDEGAGPSSPEQSPRTPKKPPSSLSSAAEIEEEPKRP